ncbi:hypothetical protein BEN47_14055 [Hymenobacter lapidarius]|uniref:Glycosyltransferase subfamily 4-like N-terminal domain-containing protein n=2 Tax=Hymenobacter lapidarius TaxID=1908237 RepID=A0A1G1T524_9BACT|nr:hypothetical protein BEN47_14055 [Hymenobacter lapidarius]
MRGKFAETLLNRPQVQVHVAGRATPDDLDYRLVEAFPRICHHAIFLGSRLSFNRLLAQGRYWRLLRVLQPAVVIVHAPELLPLTLLWQWLGKGRKFIYDIQENYALNVSTQRVYRGLVRRGVAAALRWVQGLAACRAAAIILAEASYADELPFLRKLPPHRVLVLENKYQPLPGQLLPHQPSKFPLPGEPLRLLFSGTISELNGILEAFWFAGQLRRAWPGGVQLTVIGFCQQPQLLRQLQQLAAENAEWLTLIGGHELVPHAQIVAEIERSHLGLLPYRPHTSTARCRPTKLFEYLAHGLPIITSPNAQWQLVLQQHGAGLQLDFDQPFDAPALVDELRGTNFYPQGVPIDVLWTEEGKKLWLLLDSLV